MGTAKLDLANPPRLSPESRAHLDAFTPEQIEINAREDIDNPPLTDVELDRLRTAATVRSIRQNRGMTQAVFASTYNIAVARLRDWEQGRFMPDAMAMSYLELIHRMPNAVEDTIAEVRAQAAASRDGDELMRSHIEANRGRHDIMGASRQLGENADQAAAELRERKQADSGNA